MAGEWKMMTLSEAGVILIDCDHRTPPAASTGFPYVAIPQLRGGRIDLSEVRRISADHFADWTRKAKPQPHDVILSRRCNPGETAYVPRGLEFALGQNLVLLRADGKSVYPPFLRWLASGPKWWEQVGKFINVGAVFDSLRCADVPKFELHIPPLPEQRAIAHILGTLDDKIELNRRMNETLEATARALFKSWFVDFDPVRAKAAGRPTGLPKDIDALFPSAFEQSELGEIPKGWRVECLGGHALNFDSKRVPVSSRERAQRKGPYPYYGAGGSMDSVNNYLFDGIYLLLGEDGSVVDGSGLGISQYVWGKCWVNNHAHVLQGKGAVSTEQLYLYFHFESVRPFVTGAVQPKLSQGRMNTMPFVFAGQDICRVFYRLIEPLFARLRACADESRTLAALRDALLPKLISGELRVKDSCQTLRRNRVCPS